MSHKHFNIDERIFIKKQFKNGESLTSIAKTLNRNKSSISRELKRFSRVYNPYCAEKEAKKKRHIIRKTTKIDANSLAYLIEKSNLNWSPDQIINRHLIDEKQKFCISTSTIYRYFKRGLFQLNQELLRHKGKYRKRHKTTQSEYKVKRVMNIIREKNQFGHWEADLIVGKHHKSYRLTIIEKLTSLTITLYLEGKTTEEVINLLIKVFSNPIIKNTARTLTLDNGTEFANWILFEEKTNIPVYFARPGTPWEKPTIEHANKLIREYLTKKSNLKDYNFEYDIALFNRLNHRPRKKLGYKTPMEVFSSILTTLLNKKLIQLKKFNIIENFN